jgi:hypothetical protein
MKGIDQVGTANAAKLARGELAVRVDRPKQPTINIPAWNDIIRTGPRTIVTEEDWRVQKHFERAGLPSPLSTDVQSAIADRRKMSDRIRNSALPEYQQGITTMITAVDNVQDAALTASVAGRVLIPALGRLGGYLAPAVLALGNFATLFNWLGLGVYYFGLLYALACKGPSAMKAQAVVPGLAGAAFKGLRGILPRMRGIPQPSPSRWQKGGAAAMMWGTTSGRALTNMRASRWSRMRITFGEALQAAQVASDLTGYGLSLGAMMGFIGETTYSAIRFTQGERVRVRSPHVNHLFAELVLPHVANLGRGAAWHREQCCRALASAPFILRDPELWGETLYGLTWLVVYTAVEPLTWDTQGLKWRELVIDNAVAEWTPWDMRDGVSRGIAQEQGVDPDRPAGWPIPGNPHAITTAELVLELGPQCARALDRWTAAAPLDPWRRFVAELAMKTTERLWTWLEGSPDFPQWELAPATAVFESLFKASRWPIVSDPPERLTRAWAASEQYIRDTGRKYIDQAELDAIWERAGTPLLRLLNDQADVPPEWYVPWDPETGEAGNVAYGETVATARARLEEIHRQQSQS